MVARAIVYDQVCGGRFSVYAEDEIVFYVLYGNI
jgi:hypothetical protein